MACLNLTGFKFSAVIIQNNTIERKGGGQPRKTLFGASQKKDTFLTTIENIDKNVL